MARQKLTDTAVRNAKPSSDGKQREVWDKLLRGFGLRVGHSGQKSFVVMTRVSGKQVRATLGPYPALSLSEAREKARGVMADAAKGIHPREAKAAAKREAQRRQADTFGAVAESFLEDYVRAKALRSAANIESQLANVLLPAWGDRPIADITRADIKDLLRTTRRKRGKGRNRRGGPIAANRLLATVSKLFNWALDEEVVQHSPAVRLTPPAPEVERDRLLSDDELRAIWAACGEMGYPFGHMIKTMIVTAQRRSEVARMHWAEVDRGAAAWTIPGERAKSGRGHLVPLSPLALEILAEAPAAGAYVFSSGRAGDRPVSGFSKAKRRCDALSGVEAWRIHDLRRTVATGMRELGVDRLTVSKVLNHAESGVTRIYDRYAADPEKRRALERWANRLEALVGGEEGKVVTLRG